MAADGILRVVSNNKADRELAEHRRSFVAFRHLVVFAALHVALTLACVALAFIGHTKLLALLLWLGSTLALIAFLAVHNTSAAGQVGQRGNFKQRV